MTTQTTTVPALRALTFATGVALLACGMSAGAATRIELHDQNVTALNKAYKAATAKIGAAATPALRHAEALGLDAQSALKVLTFNQDQDGTRHYRYQQTFRGVPIWGEQVIVTEGRDGKIKNLFGRSVDRLAADLPLGQKLIGKANALAAAKHAALGNGVSALHVQHEQIEQMIYLARDGRASMTYVVNFFADTPKGGKPTRPFVILDARTGKVLEKWDGLTTSSQIGTGPGGNQKTGQYEWGSGGRYGFLDVTQSGTTCTMNNAKVKTVNLNGGTSSTTAFAYTCPRNTVKTINGGFSPLNDAHYFGGMITGMYPAYTGYDALSFQLVMRTHYSSSYENAFWDGSTMSFGDGASTFYPLVSVDVAGHEVSHGFTEQHSNLTYSGMSGGMNEAFSDMGGEATEYFWKGSNDFLVGEEIFKGASGQALRYMCNPTQDGGSIDNAADYTSSLDVHYSSGVYNKAFCTLAKKSGWDTPKAFKVFARANALYWTASSTFNAGACGVETAATDLGLTKADVTAAFTAVGVSCTGGGGGGGGGTTGGTLSNGVTVTGINNPAGSSANYTLAVPSGASGLKFVMSGGSGDADMYVKFGSAPTDSSYDCRPYVSGNAETCNIATAQAGTYYVRVKAYSDYSGVSLTGSYTTGGGGGGGGGGGDPSQIVANSSFESTGSWTGSSGVICATGCSGQSAHTGTGFAWLDGYGSSHTDTLSQAVTVPSGKTSGTLTFYLHVATNETTTTSKYDKLYVRLYSGSTLLKTLGTYSNLNKNSGYGKHSYNVSSYLSKPNLTVKFTGTEDSSQATSFVIDDVTLTVN